MSKGDTPRPLSVKPETFAERWERTFRGALQLDAQADGQFQAKPSDPADAKASRSRRVGNWTVEQWLAYLERNPDATLPSGVGWAIVEHLRG